MRPTSTWLLTFALVCAAAPPAAASAQDVTEVPPESTESADSTTTEVLTEEPDVVGPDAVAYNAQILDEVLRRSANQTIREQKFAAAAGVAGGTIMLGVGSWRLLENDPATQFSRGLGVMFMTLGMVDLTTGIFVATRTSQEKRRLARWERALRDGITAVELAHFEGELQASGETREGERLLLRWNGITHTLAGVFVLAFTPIPDSMSGSDRVSGYLIGGLFVAIGMGTFGASFRATPSEKAWKEYNKRKVPMPGHGFSWGIAPSISRQGAGLSFGGTF